jgi:putative tryptophan/tyrosine transport system substrate-binding protein
MNRRAFVAGLGVLLAAPRAAKAQQAKPYRIGVLFQGGPYYAVVDGLREGLRDFKLEEGTHFVVDIRDGHGNLGATEKAAQDLEREGVSLIYAIGTTDTAAVRRATARTPIVFCVGVDPVAFGLVEGFAKPGGRLTGVHWLGRELTEKRLEILKEILPTLRRVVAFYNPDRGTGSENAKLAREAARQLRVDIVERHVTSVEQLRTALDRLKTGEVDAYFYVGDAMVVSQAQVIVDTLNAKRIPTMFHERSIVAKGALAGYGVNYREVGRLSAKHVQRVLTGTSPKDLPIENTDRLELIINLKTAKALGLTIPPSLLLRADQIIE